MNKPDWKDAPDWANWLAMDDGGEWYWFNEKPTRHSDGTWRVNCGQILSAPKPNWRQTLESNPSRSDD